MKLPNSQKGFTPRLILIIIALVGVSGFISLQYFKNNKESNSDFKTYQNKQFGFEFRYDKNSKVDFDGNDNGLPYLWLLKLGNPGLVEKRVDNGKEYESHDSESYFNLEIYKDKNCPVKEDDLKNSTTKEVVIGGLKASLIEGDGAYDTHRSSICLTKNDHLYWFLNEYYEKSSESVKDQSKVLFDKIISTLKFTN